MSLAHFVISRLHEPPSNTMASTFFLRHVLHQALQHQVLCLDT